MLALLRTLRSRAIPFAAMATALLATSCNYIRGEYDATTEFLVSPQASGTFWGWSEITISQDTSSVKSARLQFARLELPDDSEADDLAFLQNITAEVVTPDQRVLVATKEQFPPEEVIVPLDLVYDGNLKDFLYDDTIRIEWTGSRNPNVEIPPDGYWVSVRVRVKVEQ